MLVMQQSDGSSESHIHLFFTDALPLQHVLPPVHASKSCHDLTKRKGPVSASPGLASGRLQAGQEVQQQQAWPEGQLMALTGSHWT